MSPRLTSAVSIAEKQADKASDIRMKKTSAVGLNRLWGRGWLGPRDIGAAIAARRACAGLEDPHR